MFSFRRLALLLALGLPAILFVQAQSSSSSPAPSEPAQAPAAAPSQPESQSQLSVQARIRLRREQRRAAAIHEIYDHLYDGYVGGGYLRFRPGTSLQRVNEYNWNGEVTRYLSERLGVTLDGRGYYGTPFIPPLQDGGSGITKPAISQYTAMGGPTYRIYIQPRYSIAVRGMGGFAQGNFSGDTNGFGGTTLGMWKDGPAFAVNGAVIAEYNVAPNLGLRLTPEYMLTGFGSTQQSSLGFTGGLVYRFGKQR
jgi:hypothetical protein